MHFNWEYLENGNFGLEFIRQTCSSWLVGQIVLLNVKGMNNWWNLSVYTNVLTLSWGKKLPFISFWHQTQISVNQTYHLPTHWVCCVWSTGRQVSLGQCPCSISKAILQMICDFELSFYDIPYTVILPLTENEVIMIDLKCKIVLQ